MVDLWKYILLEMESWLKFRKDTVFKPVYLIVKLVKVNVLFSTRLSADKVVTIKLEKCKSMKL